MTKKRPILHPVIFIMLLSAILGFSLAVIETVSQEQIEINYYYDIQKSLLYAANIDTEGKTRAEINTLYKEHLSEEKLGGIHYYTFQENGVIQGYCFPFIGDGLWGSISGYMAVNVEGTKLIGLVFTSHSETPGLGGRIDELWFKEQFRGLDISGLDNFVVYRLNDEPGLDALTGATTTSNSVRDFLNKSILELKKIIKEDLHE